MNEVALGVAVLALLLAGLAWRRADLLARQVSVLAEDLTQHRRLMEQAQEEAAPVASQDRAVAKFVPSMTITEALAVHPGVRDLLGRFELDSCAECAVSDVDTLEGACRSYGVDLEALMEALAGLVAPVTEGHPRAN